jgi:hypothetical protein
MKELDLSTEPESTKDATISLEEGTPPQSGSAGGGVEGGGVQNREQPKEEIKSKDFSAERPEKTIVRTESYDPRPAEDSARRTIAYLLIGLLIWICVSSLCLVIALPDYLEKIMRLLELILSPVVALVSAATGFYYGTKTNANKT